LSGVLTNLLAGKALRDLVDGLQGAFMSMGTGAKPAPPPFPSPPSLPKQAQPPAAAKPATAPSPAAKPATAPSPAAKPAPSPAQPPQAQDYVRASERFDLEVKVDLESDHNFYTGLTQNISSGGLFIATHALRKIGDRITLKFSLPGTAEPVSVQTEVRWIRENSALQRTDGGTGMGVRFVDLSAEASAAITRFLESRDSLFYDDE
jgi:uncharacterized protein (TIGR02266 family)